MSIDKLNYEFERLNVERRYLEDIILKNQNSLTEIKKKIKFLSDILFPNVSLSEIKLKDKDYYVIKGSYQVIDEYGKKIRLSVFVGRKDEFTEGKNDERAIKIATDKIKLLLNKQILIKNINMYLHM
jgi:hypothetical protein